MRYALLFLLMVGSALEYSAQGRFGIAMVTGLYFFLLMQAEHAAKRYLKYGLLMPVPVGPDRQEAPKKKFTVEDVLEVPRLGERKSSDWQAKAEARKRQEKKSEPKAEAKQETKQQPKTELPKAEPKPQPKAPDFRGRPHEVLAVNQNAATQTIVRAFRKWVKEYHPDHARTVKEAQSANEHTRCLTDAKDKMLQKRKQMHKPKAT